MTDKRVNIVADIGGTNARFAYVTSHTTQLQCIEYFPCAEFPMIADVIRCYIEQENLKKVDHICLAVAGQTELDKIDILNNHWVFSRMELERRLAVPVKIINDFTAQALSIDSLKESDLFWFGSPRPSKDQVKAIAGPGTGLGVAALMPGGDIVPSEAGHVAFAPTNEHEIEILKILWQRHQRVSVERLLSGMGLCNLYWANGQLQGIEGELTAPEITDGAIKGDVLCLTAIEDFFAILGAVAGDVALMMGAFGGFYLSGGILPKIRQFLDVGVFREHFENKGRYREFCSNVPVAMILAKHLGLMGCAEALRHNNE